MPKPSKQPSDRNKFYIIAIVATSACASIATGQTINVPGARAIDGDSIAIDVRLKGVDAFEHDAVFADTRGRCTSCGKAAQNSLAAILDRGQQNGSIKISFSKSHSYNRIVGTAESSGMDIGESMIVAGYAVPLPEFLRDDPERAERYAKAYETAINQKKGAFAGTWIIPKEWRQGQRLACEAPS